MDQMEEESIRYGKNLMEKVKKESNAVNLNELKKWLKGLKDAEIKVFYHNLGIFYP